MEIKELILHKIDLEEQIQQSIVDHLECFAENTGIGVYGIEIEMIEVTEMGDKTKQHIVADCNVCLNV